MVAYGEFWHVRLNLDPHDIGVIKKATNSSRFSRNKYINVAGQYSHENTFALVSSDFNDRFHKYQRAVVLPRTTKSRPGLMGHVPSPKGDGGCSKAADIDCFQVYSILKREHSTDEYRSQLIKKVSERQTAQRQTTQGCRKQLGLYFGEIAHEDWFWTNRGGAIPARRIPIESGQVCEIKLKGGVFEEVVVISNTHVHRQRPLDLLTVVPIRPTKETQKTPFFIELDPIRDTVRLPCIAHWETPITISGSLHVSRRSLAERGRIHPSSLRKIRTQLLHCLGSQAPEVDSNSTPRRGKRRRKPRGWTPSEWEEYYISTQTTRARLISRFSEVQSETWWQAHKCETGEGARKSEASRTSDRRFDSILSTLSSVLQSLKPIEDIHLVGEGAYTSSIEAGSNNPTVVVRKSSNGQISAIPTTPLPSWWFMVFVGKNDRIIVPAEFRDRSGGVHAVRWGRRTIPEHIRFEPETDGILYALISREDFFEGEAVVLEEAIERIVQKSYGISVAIARVHK